MRITLIIAFTLALSMGTGAAQTWKYQSYGSRAGGVVPLAPGTVTLVEKDGRAIFRMSAGPLSKCYRGDLNALVTRADATTIITVPPLLTSCEEIRFVIKNDGTGGQREVKQGSEWVWDGFDRELTLQK